MKNKNINPKIVLMAIVGIILLLTATIVFTQKMYSDKISTDGVRAYSIAPTVATSHTQTNTYLVKSVEGAYVGAGTYWYQIADRRWRADTQFGTVTVANKNNYPTATVVKERHDLTNWVLKSDSKFLSDNGRIFNGTQLNEKYIASANDAKFLPSNSYSGKGIEVESGTKVIIKFESGYGYTPTEYTLKPGSKTHYDAMYLTPFEVYWSGKVLETYEISTDQPFTIGVNQSKNVNAFVRSKTGTDAWTGYRDVTLAPETTWKSDNPSVATVDSKGLVKGIKQGTATISATWKSGDYHIIAKTVVTVEHSNDPILIIEGTPNACFDKGQLFLGAYYYANKDMTTVTNLAETKWTSSDTSVATVKEGKVTFKKVGKVTITVTYKDISTSVEVNITDCSPPPTPSPEEPGEPEKPVVPENKPPTVKIEGKKEVLVGTNICFRANATDEDGYITDYAWDLPNFEVSNEDTNTSTVCGFFTQVGDFELGVTVYDNGDQNGDNIKDASAWHMIKVVTMPPQAYVFIEGTLKENREIIARPHDAYNGNFMMWAIAPIVKETLTIEAVDEANKDKVKIVQNISGNVSHNQNIQFLAKFTGKVKVTRYVENNRGQSDTFETIITIAPDLPPIVDFDVVTLTYREPQENDVAEALITLYNRSYSTDGDFLNYFEYTVAYDKQNNGSFSDVVVIKSSDYELNKYYPITTPGGHSFRIKIDNSYNLEIESKYVGKYGLELLGFECFGNACERFPIKN